MNKKLQLHYLSQCGQGSYGKVLTAFAEEIDELLAVKQVTILLC